MGDHTKIEWTDASWNPIRGCSRISEGCRNCYAEAVAARFSAPGQAYAGLATMKAISHDDKDGRVLKTVPRWTGDVAWVADHLYDPLRWKRPRRVFVNSMSDLFHEGVPDEWIDQIFAVMALAPRHTFQCLTKRPGRMLAYLRNTTELRGRILGRAWEMLGHPPWDEYAHEGITERAFPLPNVWLGVSVEDQLTADDRIQKLLRTPAAVRWVSYEPALGPIDFETIMCGIGFASSALEGYGHLDWIVCGGESGHGARPMDPMWARQARDQCANARVPFFFKQWGEWMPFDQMPDRLERNGLVTTKMSDDVMVVRVGKKAAGRELDDRTWDQYPDTK